MSDSGQCIPVPPEDPKQQREAFAKQLMNFAQLAIHNGEQLGLNVNGIRIVASYDCCDGTGSTALASAGAGNWHAQMGAVAEWLQSKRSYEDGYNQAHGMTDYYANNPDKNPEIPDQEEDEGEAWKRDD